MDKSTRLIRASNFNFLSICMWKLLFSQGGTWAFVVIIYLYYKRPRKPQRGPCNVRGHTDTMLPQGTQEAEGCSQDRWTLAHPLLHMKEPGKTPPRSHGALCKLGALGLYVGYDFKAQQVKPPHWTAPQHCTDGRTDRHTEMPLALQICGAASGLPGRQMPLQDELADKPQLKAAA